MKVECPGLIVKSEANQREHWAVKHRRKKAQQLALACYLNQFTRNRLKLPAVITFTRVGGRRMDSDNLAGAFKHCRDQLAAWLRIDDGDERLTWEYRQEKGESGIRVEIRAT